MVGTLAGETGVEDDVAHAVPPSLRASSTQESPEVSPGATVYVFAGPAWTTTVVPSALRRWNS